MTNSNYPRLSGGTFFILVLQALRQRMKAREHYKGESDGLKDPNVLIGLIKVINPDYVAPAGDALKTKTNDFKSCKLSKGEYLPFGKTAEIEEFDNRIQNDYGSALGAMAVFVEQFLETGTAAKKDVRLVKALMELIQADDSISANDEFYIFENGNKIKKAALGDLRDICLPAFLLGVWHYVVVNRKDNKVGQDTYNNWCPPAGGGPREYTGNIGKAITRDINVYSVNISDRPENAANNEPKADVHEECPIPAIAELKLDYKDLLIYCMENDPCGVPIKITLADEIEAANGRWKYKVREITDAAVRKLAIDIMQTLDEYALYISDLYMRVIPGRDVLWFRNESIEEGNRLRDDMQPNTRRLRQTMADLYRRLFPIPEDEDFVEHEEKATQSAPVGNTMMNNNPLFIQQNGDGNVVVPNYGTINITFGKK